MKVNKHAIDRAITMLVAIAAPLFPLLIRHGVLSAQDAQDAGAVLFAAVGSYHGGAAVQRRRSTPSVPDINL